MKKEESPTIICSDSFLLRIPQPFNPFLPKVVTVHVQFFIFGNMSEQDLFFEFPPVSPNDWKEKILKDLKGKDYQKNLVWETPEGIKVEPFYVPANQKALSVFRSKISWGITAPVQISETANAEALENLNGGCTEIHFINTGKTFDISQLTQDIQTDIAALSFEGVTWDESHSDFWLKNKNSKSHLGINPLASLHQGLSNGYESKNLLKWIKFRNELQATWGLLLIDGSIYKNSGGHITDEIAFILTALQENLHQLRNLKITSNSIGTILIKTAIGPNFFFEIAKLKAIQHLAKIITEQYEGAEIKILAESSSLYHSYLDTETNILRLTTEAMSAAIGGADSIMLHPFDNPAGTDLSRRVSRNIHHLLIEESFFEKQADPAKGSYYIENLVRELKETAWKVFLEIEKNQGYIQSYKDKTIPKLHIQNHRENLKDCFAHQKTIMIGSNQYPNLKDNIGHIQDSTETESQSPLHSFRLSEPFENLRVRLQNHIQENLHTPKAFLWLHGNQSIRKARAIFSYNFLASAGILSIENSDPGNWELSIEEMNKSNSSIIVLCSDNDSWEKFLPKAIETISKDKLIILAGENKSFEGMTIHRNSNALECLNQIFRYLGIG